MGYKANINLALKQQERSNMNNNNHDDSNTNNENSFTNENNSQVSEKQLSFITLPYKGQQGKKVLKSFKTTLQDLYQITWKQK